MKEKVTVTLWALAIENEDTGIEFVESLNHEAHCANYARSEYWAWNFNSKESALALIRDNPEYDFENAHPVKVRMTKVYTEKDLEEELRHMSR